jgi:hypothetical protein
MLSDGILWCNLSVDGETNGLFMNYCRVIRSTKIKEFEPIMDQKIKNLEAI